MRDIFKFQDEIVQSLVTTVGLQLSMLEKGMVIPQRTNNLEAYDYFLRGLEEWFTLTLDAYARSRYLFQKAIGLDSGYADAYAYLGLLSWVGYAWLWDKDPHALDRAEQLARKAVLLDDSNSNAYAVLGWVAVMRNRPDEAIADCERAIELDANNLLAYLALSNVSGMAGKHEAQLTYALRAMRLDPRHPETYLLDVGVAYNYMGRYREAADALRATEAKDPWTHAELIYSYTELGREQDAKAEAAEVLRLAPKFSLEVVRKRIPGDWDAPPKRRFLDDLSKAGLK
jgi:adenylate cyclase